MLWNYPINPGFYFHSAFQLVGFTASQSSQQPSSPSIQEGGKNQLGEKKKKMLNISEEDLKESNYSTNKMVWTEEEDNELIKLRTQDNLDWNTIATLMPKRNSKMCYSRFRRLENATKQIWRKADDTLLLELVEQKGQDWKEISQFFPKRTHKQIKEHYNNYLKNGIKRDDWTIEQDLKLVNLINKYGRQWKRIEELFQGRTQNQIKNRFFGRLKKISDKNTTLKQRARLSEKRKSNFRQQM